VIATFEFAQLVVSAVGLALVAASVSFLAWQTLSLAKQTELSANATRAAIYQNIAQLMIDIDRFFVDRPQFKAYFYAGAEVPESGQLRDQIWSVAEMFLDFAENVRCQSPLMPEYPWDTWGGYFKLLHDESPVLREVLNDYVDKGWYPIALQTLFQRGEMGDVRQGL